jgi:16S rRNA (cytosine1402-N4)-methyltransferase
VPVLLDETISALSPRDDALYLDGTFGGGGYARAILDSARCRVIAIDRDAAAIERGRALAAHYQGRLELVHGRFGEMDALLAGLGRPEIDGGVVLDLGVSSQQLDDPERGFSFRHDGPLDARMDATGDAPSAADVVNGYEERHLADIIRRLGEERYARRVARAIVAARKAAPITRTGQLADIVRGAVPRSADGLDPATRTFQALRVHINDELGEVRRGLAAAERLLCPSGRLAVVSFESLSDRIIKNFLRARSGEAPRPSRHRPAAQERPPSFRMIHRRPVRPGRAELAANPRARSARLRAAERTEHPAWPEASAETQGEEKRTA